MKRKSRFILLDNDNKLVDWFDSYQSVQDYVEEEDFGNGYILEVVSAIQIYPPDDPNYEYIKVDLKKMEC